MKKDKKLEENVDNIITKFNIIAGRAINDERKISCQISRHNFEKRKDPLNVVYISFLKATEIHESDPNDAMRSPNFLPKEKKTLINFVLDTAKNGNFKEIFQRINIKGKYKYFYPGDKFKEDIRPVYKGSTIIEYEERYNGARLVRNYVRSVSNLAREAYKEIKDILLAIKSSKSSENKENYFKNIPDFILEKIIVKCLAKKIDVNGPLCLEKAICNEYFADIIERSEENLLVKPIFDSIKESIKRK